MSTAFFLSTGRCGTQWLADALGTTYRDLAVVTHEPIKYHYHPKRFLRAYSTIEQLLEDPVVKAHVLRIGEARAAGKAYIETGWPCYVAVPLFARLFADDIKLVHLIRHPVPTAASLVTHNLYGGRQNIERAELNPEDPGVLLKNLATRWSGMTQFEKCLFWWTEINLYATELRERYPQIPFMTLRFEEIMDPASGALQELAEFLELPKRSELTASLAKPVDRYIRRTEHPIEWTSIKYYPQTIDLARRYGYRPDEVDGQKIKQRYRKSLLGRGLLQALRWMKLEDSWRRARSMVVKQGKRASRLG